METATGTDRIKCFVLTRANRVRRSLRRFSSHAFTVSRQIGVEPGKDSTIICPGPWKHHHDAVVLLDELEVPAPAEGQSESFFYEVTAEQKATGAWPVKCDHCDYAFVADDGFDIWADRLWTDGVKLYSLSDAPAGAMWNAFWHRQKGDDGISLTVMLPDGTHWYVDGPAFTERGIKKSGWSRMGTIPDITVVPKVQTKGFVGTLKDGYLERAA